MDFNPKPLFQAPLEVARHYERLLGLDEPWSVSALVEDIPGRRIDLQLVHASGTRFACPHCQQELANYQVICFLRGDEETVDWLLKDGGDGIARSGDKLPPLLAAILPTRIEKADAVRQRLVARLIKAGADPNAARSGINLIYQVICRNNLIYQVI